nr:energy transducer TonB [uncultured Flavobacterium sp.]
MNKSKSIVSTLLLFVSLFLFSCKDTTSTSTNSIVVPKQETDDTTVYSEVDKIASPALGLSAFYSNISLNFVYPEDFDHKLKDDLRVYISFIVEKDGSFSDVKLLRDPGYGLGQEALRVLNESENWIPATKNVVVVRSQYTLPITIKPS